MSKIKSSFTAMAIASCEGLYTIDDLGVEVPRPKNFGVSEGNTVADSATLDRATDQATLNSVLKGISFPADADKRLFTAAEKLVTALNQMHILWKKEGEDPHSVYGSFFLRSLIVKSTAILAKEFDDFPSRQSDEISKEMAAARLSKIFAHTRVAYDLQRVVDYLEHDPNPVLQALGDDLHEFVKIFACTQGASPYTVFALFKSSSDGYDTLNFLADGIVHNRCSLPVQRTQTP